jgi:hypothetical protein
LRRCGPRDATRPIQPAPDLTAHLFRCLCLATWLKIAVNPSQRSSRVLKHDTSAQESLESLESFKCPPSQCPKPFGQSTRSILARHPRLDLFKYKYRLCGLYPTVAADVRRESSPPFGHLPPATCHRLPLRPWCLAASSTKAGNRYVTAILSFPALIPLQCSQSVQMNR